MKDVNRSTRAGRTRLRRIARVGQIIGWGGFVLTIGWVAAALAMPELRAGWLAGMGLDLGERAMAGTLVAALPALLFGLCLWQAGTLFGALRGEMLYSLRATTALVRLGWLAVATALAGIACRTGLAYIASLGSVDGKRTLAISLSSSDIGALLVGLLALAFALVMAEARRLDDDSRSIV